MIRRKKTNHETSRSARVARSQGRRRNGYNRRTATYVMVLTEVGGEGGHLIYSTSQSRDGRFTYRGWSYGASNSKTMDLGAHQEGDGAYVVYSDNNCGVSIARFNDEYLSVRQRVAHIQSNDCQCGSAHANPNYGVAGWMMKGRRRVLKGCEEGPAIVKVDGLYFLVTSWCSGWQPSQCHYRIAKSLSGPRNPEPDGSLGDDTSFGSQTGFILTITKTKGSTYINIADRWMDNTEVGATYPWLPLKIKGSSMSLEWHDAWYLDLDAGTWSPQAPGKTPRLPE